jgi:hypothetical protein
MIEKNGRSIGLQAAVGSTQNQTSRSISAANASSVITGISGVSEKADQITNIIEDFANSGQNASGALDATKHTSDMSAKFATDILMQSSLMEAPEIPTPYFPPLLYCTEYEQVFGEHASTNSTVVFSFRDIGNLFVEDESQPRAIAIQQVPDADEDSIQDMGRSSGVIKISGRIFGQAGLSRFNMLRDLCHYKGKEGLIFIDKNIGKFRVYPANIPGYTSSAEFFNQYAFQITLIIVGDANKKKLSHKAAEEKIKYALSLANSGAMMRAELYRQLDLFKRIMSDVTFSPSELIGSLKNLLIKFFKDINDDKIKKIYDILQYGINGKPLEVNKDTIYSTFTKVDTAKLRQYKNVVPSPHMPNGFTDGINKVFWLPAYEKGTPFTVYYKKFYKTLNEEEVIATKKTGEFADRGKIIKGSVWEKMENPANFTIEDDMVRPNYEGLWTKIIFNIAPAKWGIVKTDVVFPEKTPIEFYTKYLSNGADQLNYLDKIYNNSTNTTSDKDPSLVADHSHLEGFNIVPYPISGSVSSFIETTGITKLYIPELLDEPNSLSGIVVKKRVGELMVNIEKFTVTAATNWDERGGVWGLIELEEELSIGDFVSVEVVLAYNVPYFFNAHPTYTIKDNSENIIIFRWLSRPKIASLGDTVQNLVLSPDTTNIESLYNSNYLTGIDTVYWVKGGIADSKEVIIRISDGNSNMVNIPSSEYTITYSSNRTGYNGNWGKIEFNSAPTINRILTINCTLLESISKYIGTFKNENILLNGNSIELFFLENILDKYEKSTYTDIYPIPEGGRTGLNGLISGTKINTVWVPNVLLNSDNTINEYYPLVITINGEISNNYIIEHDIDKMVKGTISKWDKIIFNNSLPIGSIVTVNFTTEEEQTIYNSRFLETIDNSKISTDEFTMPLVPYPISGSVSSFIETTGITKLYIPELLDEPNSLSGIVVKKRVGELMVNIEKFTVTAATNWDERGGVWGLIELEEELSIGDFVSVEVVLDHDVAYFSNAHTAYTIKDDSGNIVIFKWLDRPSTSSLGDTVQNLVLSPDTTNVGSLYYNSNYLTGTDTVYWVKGGILGGEVVIRISDGNSNMVNIPSSEYTITYLTTRTGYNGNWGKIEFNSAPIINRILTINCTLLEDTIIYTSTFKNENILLNGNSIELFFLENILDRYEKSTYIDICPIPEGIKTGMNGVINVSNINTVWIPNVLLSLDNTINEYYPLIIKIDSEVSNNYIVEYSIDKLFNGINSKWTKIIFNSSLLIGSIVTVDFTTEEQQLIYNDKYLEEMDSSKISVDMSEPALLLSGYSSGFQIQSNIVPYPISGSISSTIETAGITKLYIPKILDDPMLISNFIVRKRIDKSMVKIEKFTVTSADSWNERVGIWSLIELEEELNVGDFVSVDVIFDQDLIYFSNTHPTYTIKDDSGKIIDFKWLDKPRIVFLEDTVQNLVLSPDTTNVGSLYNSNYLTGTDTVYWVKGGIVEKDGVIIRISDGNSNMVNIPSSEYTITYSSNRTGYNGNWGKIEFNSAPTINRILTINCTLSRNIIAYNSTFKNENVLLNYNSLELLFMENVADEYEKSSYKGIYPIPEGAKTGINGVINVSNVNTVWIPKIVSNSDNTINEYYPLIIVVNSKVSHDYNIECNVDKTIDGITLKWTKIIFNSSLAIGSVVSVNFTAEEEQIIYNGKFLEEMDEYIYSDECKPMKNYINTYLYYTPLCIDTSKPIEIKIDSIIVPENKYQIYKAVNRTYENKDGAILSQEVGGIKFLYIPGDKVDINVRYNRCETPTEEDVKLSIYLAEDEDLFLDIKDYYQRNILKPETIMLPDINGKLYNFIKCIYKFPYPNGKSYITYKQGENTKEFVFRPYDGIGETYKTTINKYTFSNDGFTPISNESKFNNQNTPFSIDLSVPKEGLDDWLGRYNSLVSKCSNPTSKEEREIASILLGKFVDHADFSDDAYITDNDVQNAKLWLQVYNAYVENEDIVSAINMLNERTKLLQLGVDGSPKEWDGINTVTIPNEQIKPIDLVPISGWIFKETVSTIKYTKEYVDVILYDMYSTPVLNLKTKYRTALDNGIYLYILKNDENRVYYDNRYFYRIRIECGSKVEEYQFNMAGELFNCIKNGQTVIVSGGNSVEFNSSELITDSELFDDMENKQVPYLNKTIFNKETFEIDKGTYEVFLLSIYGDIDAINLSKSLPYYKLKKFKEIVGHEEASLTLEDGLKYYSFSQIVPV